mmetsp:Transcript_18284/g.70642  ORF Transcript_18284/g.70642 Transcript_18284/m.70642 type:complete len:144 (-) Transcript_18284:1840-2271(-)
MLAGMDRTKRKGKTPPSPAPPAEQTTREKVRAMKADPSLLTKSALRQGGAEAFDEMARAIRKLPSYRGFNACEELHNTARDFATFDPAVGNTMGALCRVAEGLEEMEASRIEILKAMRDLTLLGDKLNCLNDRLKESLQGKAK